MGVSLILPGVRSHAIEKHARKRASLPAKALHQANSIDRAQNARGRCALKPRLILLRRAGNPLPTCRTLRDVRIVTVRVMAIVPILRVRVRSRFYRQRWSDRCHDDWLRIIIRRGIIGWRVMQRQHQRRTDIYPDPRSSMRMAGVTRMTRMTRATAICPCSAAGYRSQ